MQSRVLKSCCWLCLIAGLELTVLALWYVIFYPESTIPDINKHSVLDKVVDVLPASPGIRRAVYVIRRDVAGTRAITELLAAITQIREEIRNEGYIDSISGSNRIGPLYALLDGTRQWVEALHLFDTILAEKDPSSFQHKFASRMYEHVRQKNSKPKFLQIALRMREEGHAWILKNLFLMISVSGVLLAAGAWSLRVAYVLHTRPFLLYSTVCGMGFGLALLVGGGELHIYYLSL